MKTWIAVALLAVAPPGIAQAGAEPGLAAPHVNVLLWPRESAADFGCYMEKTLHHRDVRFNCALRGYRNRADICRNPDAYYEGPDFPDELASTVHPLATHIGLSWEHGNLQAVGITLKGTWNEADVRRVFGLPRTAAFGLTVAEQKAHAWPRNIMDTGVRFPTQDITEVTLTGFDHIGGADVGCGE
nr:hypothetical protein [Dyella japonica]